MYRLFLCLKHPNKLVYTKFFADVVELVDTLS